MATSKIEDNILIQFKIAVAHDVGQAEICSRLGLTTAEFRKEFAQLLLKNWEPALTWSPTSDVVPFGILPNDIKEILTEGGNKIANNRLFKFRKNGALIEFSALGYDEEETQNDGIFDSLWQYINFARVRSLSVV